MLCNLLENAVKYSPPEAIVSLSVSVPVKEGYLEVSVCNTGSAFPPEQPEQVLDLLTRGQQKPAVAGTGIGLAVCRAIVLAQEGTLTAGNAGGRAGVRFTLPLGMSPNIEGDQL